MRIEIKFKRFFFTLKYVTLWSFREYTDFAKKENGESGFWGFCIIGGGVLIFLGIMFWLIPHWFATIISIFFLFFGSIFSITWIIKFVIFLWESRSCIGEASKVFQKIADEEHENRN